MMGERIAISRQNRNLSLGWTNSVHQEWNSDYSASWLAVNTPAAPGWQGGPRSVFREYADAARGNNGNAWRWALFVGGRRVVRILDQDMYGANVLDALAYPGPFKVILADKEA